MKLTLKIYFKIPLYIRMTSRNTINCFGTECKRTDFFNLINTTIINLTRFDT